MSINSQPQDEAPPLKAMPIRTRQDREWEAENIRRSFVRRSKRIILDKNRDSSESNQT